ncbi:MAG TPA: hypothetical protein V6D14_00610 [Coleofasciculaceae cyanobacterium]|jgi:hypothetical protein
MKQFKLRFNRRLAVKLTLASMGTLLCLTPALKAQASTPACPSSNSQPLYFGESASYKVSICSAENNQNHPKYYVATAKNGSSGITLPLSAYQKVVFRASSSGYTHTLSATSGQLIVQLPNGGSSIESLVKFGPVNHFGH